ncbi:MAG TPA: NEW3 domain-containing protein, partial [Candidatus Limnocylindrales bacterium]|nr:NEW3 domain-containing protein [Candidatus Limnocylindrales bacterium]
KNDGTGPLTNVKMSATQPTNWKITFDQDTIAQIAPGAKATVTATITPVGEAVTGDYQITISANAPGENGTGAAKGDLNMTFTVETSPIWLLAGIALIIAILVGLFYVFRTYGRR